MDEIEMNRRLVFLETVGSIIWFFMDAFWMLVWTSMAKSIIFLVVFFNFAVFLYTKRIFADMAITFAMNAWLFMNIFWMLSDLNKNPQLLVYSRWCFFFGCVSLASAFFAGLRRAAYVENAISRFRRFRISR